MAAELPPNPDLIRQINLIIQKLPIAPDATLNQTSTGIFLFRRFIG